jgi:hypothetical protein
VDLVAELEGRALDGGGPQVDVHATGVVDERAAVVDLVPRHQHPFGQSLRPELGPDREQHVDARLLQVREVDDVVHVTVGVHV